MGGHFSKYSGLHFHLLDIHLDSGNRLRYIDENNDISVCLSFRFGSDSGLAFGHCCDNSIGVDCGDALVSADENQIVWYVSSVRFDLNLM